MATAEQRDAAQTHRVATGALHAANGDRETAARNLRGQAADACGGAQTALAQKARATNGFSSFSTGRDADSAPPGCLIGGKSDRRQPTTTHPQHPGILRLQAVAVLEKLLRETVENGGISRVSRG